MAQPEANKIFPNTNTKFPGENYNKVKNTMLKIFMVLGLH